MSILDRPSCNTWADTIPLDKDPVRQAVAAAFAGMRNTSTHVDPSTYQDADFMLRSLDMLGFKVVRKISGG